MITSVVKKKKLNKHNFVGEANWSGFVSFHFVNYATLTKTVYVLIFAPLHYATHLRWTFQSSVINMILFFSSILDKHAPLCKRVITIRPRAPWYSEEIKEQKVICRKLERRWRRSWLTSDYQFYTDQRTVVKNTIFKSKMYYYSSLIYSAESDSKTLFRTITRLPALLQLISPINSSIFLRRKSSISEVILVHL